MQRRSPITCHTHAGAFLIPFALTASLHAQGQFANTWYVDDDADGDGGSWAQAFNTVQQALTEAAISEGNDLVKVAQGTYKPGMARSHHFAIPDETTLRGGYNGAEPEIRDVDLYETILSGDIGDPGDNSDNSYNVVTVAASVDTGVILDGFTIKGGNGNTTLGPSDTRRGAGIRIK